MTDSTEATKRPRWRRRGVIVPVAVAATLVLAGTAFATEPWTLFTDSVVDEALPAAVGPAVEGDPAPSGSSDPSGAGATESPAPLAPTQSAPSAEPSDAGPDPTAAPTKSAKPKPTPSASKTQSPAAGPNVLAKGSFISHEHTTSGNVRVLKLADGTRVLRIEGLDTSNGPDLHVWITDAPVIQGRDGWFVFDDGAYVDLGPLKGNQGNQNYTLPAGVDLGDLTSVSIWCQRFRVSFGAAALS